MDNEIANKNKWFVFLTISAVFVMMLPTFFFRKQKVGSEKISTPRNEIKQQSGVNPNPGVDPYEIIGLIKLTDLNVILSKDNLSEDTNRFISKNKKITFDYPSFVKVYEFQDRGANEDMVSVIVTSNPDDYAEITNLQECLSTYGESAVCGIPIQEYLSIYFYKESNGSQPDPVQLEKKVSIAGDDIYSQNVYLSGESAIKYSTLGNVLPDGKVDFFGNASLTITREVLPNLRTYYTFFNKDVRVSIETHGSVYTWPYKQAIAQIVNSYLGYPERLTSFDFHPESEWKR